MGYAQLALPNSLAFEMTTSTTLLSLLRMTYLRDIGSATIQSELLVH